MNNLDTSFSTEHVRASFETKLADVAVLWIEAIEPADEKTLLSELGDIAKLVYDSIAQRLSSAIYARGFPHKLSVRLTSRKAPWAWAVEAVENEWQDMGLLGHPIESGKQQFWQQKTWMIALPRAEAKIVPLGQRNTKGPRWKSAHSPPGQKFYREHRSRANHIVARLLEDCGHCDTPTKVTLKPQNINLGRISPAEKKMGTKVEKEHVVKAKDAIAVAAAHWKEDPKYYAHGKKKGVFPELSKPKSYLAGVDSLGL